jgi:hypothetical protein
MGLQMLTGLIKASAHFPGFQKAVVMALGEMKIGRAHV